MDLSIFQSRQNHSIFLGEISRKVHSNDHEYMPWMCLLFLVCTGHMGKISFYEQAKQNGLRTIQNLKLGKAHYKHSVGKLC
jgi:hypothetical protein